ESMKDIEIGNLLIPTVRKQDYPLRIVYSSDPAPRISVVDLVNKPELAARLKDKVVFLGVTSLSSGDRITTPTSAQGHPIPGVEVHAQTFETLERGTFLTDATDGSGLALCVAVAILMALIFALLAGW